MALLPLMVRDSDSAQVQGAIIKAARRKGVNLKLPSTYSGDESSSETIGINSTTLVSSLVEGSTAFTANGAIVSAPTIMSGRLVLPGTPILCTEKYVIDFVEYGKGFPLQSPAVTGNSLLVQPSFFTYITIPNDVTFRLNIAVQDYASLGNDSTAEWQYIALTSSDIFPKTLTGLSGLINSISAFSSLPPFFFVLRYSLYSSSNTTFTDRIFPSALFISTDIHRTDLVLSEYQQWFNITSPGTVSTISVTPINPFYNTYLRNKWKNHTFSLQYRFGTSSNAGSLSSWTSLTFNTSSSTPSAVTILPPISTSQYRYLWIRLLVSTPHVSRYTDPVVVGEYIRQ